MQDKPPMQGPPQFQQESQMKNYLYKNSVLAPNAISKICSELTSTEILEEDVEKYLVEMADNFINTTFDSACSLARHKNSDKVEASDIASAIYDNFGIYEPSNYTADINKMNINISNTKNIFENNNNINNMNLSNSNSNMNNVKNVNPSSPYPWSV